MWEEITNHINTMILPNLKQTTLSPNLNFQSGNSDINHIIYNLDFKDGRVSFKIENVNNELKYIFISTTVNEIDILSILLQELHKNLRLSYRFISEMYFARLQLRGINN